MLTKMNLNVVDSGKKHIKKAVSHAEKNALQILINLGEKIEKDDKCCELD